MTGRSVNCGTNHITSAHQMIPCTIAVPLVSFIGMISVLSPDRLEPSRLESTHLGDTCKLGKGHDAAVLGWKAAIQQEMNGSQVDTLHPV